MSDETGVNGLPTLRMEVPPDLRIRTRGGKREVFDGIRGIWVALTPEEWVRQHAIHLLIERLGVPRGLIAVERGLTWQQTHRRADIIAFDRQGRPWLVVECKAPSVPVSQDVLDQAGRYKAATAAPYVLVTNGVELVGWEATSDGGYRIMQELPTPLHS